MSEALLGSFRKVLEHHIEVPGACKCMFVCLCVRVYECFR